MTVRRCLIILVTWLLLWRFSFCWDQTLTVNGLLTSTGWADTRKHTSSLVSHILHLYCNTYTFHIHFQFLIWLIFWRPRILTPHLCAYTHTHIHRLKLHTVWSHISFDYGNVCRERHASVISLSLSQATCGCEVYKQTPSPTHTYVAKWQTAAFLLVLVTHLINWLLYVSGMLAAVCVFVCVCDSTFLLAVRKCNTNKTVVSINSFILIN